MTKLNPLLIGLSAVMLGAAPWMIDRAPYESTMGLVNGHVHDVPRIGVTRHDQIPGQ